MPRARKRANAANTPESREVTAWGMVIEERIRVLQRIYEAGGSVSDAPWAARGRATTVGTAPITRHEDDEDECDSDADD